MFAFSTPYHLPSFIESSMYKFKCTHNTKGRIQNHLNPPLPETSLVVILTAYSLVFFTSDNSSNPFIQSDPVAQNTYQPSQEIIPAVIVACVVRFFSFRFFIGSKIADSSLPPKSKKGYLLSFIPIDTVLICPIMEFFPQSDFFCSFVVKGLSIFIPLQLSENSVETKFPSTVPTENLFPAACIAMHRIFDINGSSMLWYWLGISTLFSYLREIKAILPSLEAMIKYGKLRSAAYVLTGNLNACLSKLPFTFSKLKHLMFISQPSDRTIPYS